MTASACARTVVAALLHLGVRDVVLCPGSRSAPLAFAVDQADRAGQLRLHVRIDERSAGFLALGLAKASGRVVPIITTSGTAVGNLFPAVMEASHSGIPLLALTADRPTTMHHTGANQTTDQAGLFGRLVRAEARISGAEGSPRAWTYQVTRLLAAARGHRSGDPGPVHLNIAFAEPLVPEPSEPGDPAPSGPTHPTPTSLDRISDPEPVELAGGPATVVLVGDTDPASGAKAREIAHAGRVPLLSEPSGNARCGEAIRTYRLLLGTELGAAVERVIMIGHPTLSRPVSRLLARDDVELVVVAPGARWVDPGLNAARVVGAVALAPGDPDWLARWRAADLVRGAELDARASELSGRSVAAAVWRSLGPPDNLVIGSSSPIRDLDLAPITPAAPRAYANRGLAGIDGTIATAVGIALAAGPTTALMGDLTFLHDVGGLLIGPLETRPALRIVVVNDDGGSIFHTLEQGAPEYAESFERVFGTPTGVQLESVVKAYGWAYANPTNLAELATLLDAPVETCEVIEVQIPRGR